MREICFPLAIETFSDGTFHLDRPRSPGGPSSGGRGGDGGVNRSQTTQERNIYMERRQFTFVGSEGFETISVIFASGVKF